jgi:uncharacterized membrane protein
MFASDPLGFVGILVAMAAAAYLTRIGGYWLIGHFRIGPLMQRILEALPGAVIAATLAPILFKGGVSALFAMIAAVVTMIIVRNDFAAVIAGVAAAALVRAAGF